VIAVTGSGEYLSGIIDADSKLLSKLKTRPNVLTLPTAAGKESSDRINYWCDLATTHFSKFDVDHKNIKALKHNDFFDEELLEATKSANFIYFSGGNPTYLYEAIKDTPFFKELINTHKNGGIIAGCSAGAMIMGEKMIKGYGFNLINNVIVIPHYGESFYSWVTNTVKLLNRGNYKLLCLEKDTYFTLNEDHIEIIGSNNIHLIFKDKHDTYKDGDVFSTKKLVI
jgi:peptidase E